MITLIAAEKGGTGKTTLATNIAAYLAHAGEDVLLLDVDSQCSSKRWFDRRTAERPELPPVQCAQASGDVCRVAKDLDRRFSQVILDAGGRAGTEMISALRAADRVILPVRASQLDLETLESAAALLTAARGFNPKLVAHVLLNCVSPNPVIREAAEARAFAAEFAEFSLLQNELCERKAYRDAMLAGQGVCELPRSTTAAAEVQLLCQELYH